MISFVYLEMRTTGENKFDFLIKSMDQLSRNVRCVRKIKRFCQSLVTRRRNRGKYLQFSSEFPEKTKRVTIYFYCIIW